jgi:hypothetical protein
MAKLILRLPDDLHDDLREEAKEARRSLHAHILYLIEQARKQAEKRAVSLRDFIGVLPALPDDELAEDALARIHGDDDEAE